MWFRWLSTDGAYFELQLHLHLNNIHCMITLACFVFLRSIYVLSLFNNYESIVHQVTIQILTAIISRIYVRMHVHYFHYSNGDEWYRLRTNINQMMMRPRAVTMYLPSVNQVTDDFVDRIKRVQNKDTHQVAQFNNEVMKWTLECKSHPASF